MSAVVWSLEWRLALRRPRLLLLNLVIPLALVLPIALSDAPPAHAAAVYAVLFVLFGTFGAAIPLIRDADAGLIERIDATGLPARRHLAARVLAGASIDAIQLLPALAVIILTARPPLPPAVPLLLPVLLFVGLLAANVLGTLVAATARSIAEAALFAAVAALFSLHAAGVFRPPAPGSAAAAIEPWIPFHALHQWLLVPAGASAAPPGADPLPALVSALACLGLLAAVAPPLVNRLARCAHR